MSDLIDRQTAIDTMKDMYRAAEKWLRDSTDDVTKARAESCMATLVEIKLRIDKTMGKGTLTDDDCMEAAKSVLGEDELPAVQPATNCSEIPNGSDDTISRQAAIDALDCINGVEEVLRSLPSAQPDHIADVSKKVSISCGQENDLISRQAARHALCKAVHKGEDIPCENQTASCLWTGTRVCDYVREIDALPTVQPERDIPVKPIETTDIAWGIPHRQAVCPKCDYYLGHVVFLGDGKGKKVTYCETCGQAIDWEGWDFE